MIDGVQRSLRARSWQSAAAAWTSHQTATSWYCAHRRSCSPQESTARSRRATECAVFALAHSLSKIACAHSQAITQPANWHALTAIPLVPFTVPVVGRSEVRRGARFLRYVRQPAAAGQRVHRGIAPAITHDLVWVPYDPRPVVHVCVRVGVCMHIYICVSTYILPRLLVSSTCRARPTADSSAAAALQSARHVP